MTRIAPPSADLLIKLALGAAAVGVIWWTVRRTGQAIDEAIPDLPDVGGWVRSAGQTVGGAIDATTDTLWTAENWARDVFDNATERRNAAISSLGAAVNPAAPTNVVYRGVNAVGGAIAGQSDWSLGSWLYDVFNPEPVPDVGIGYGAIDARRIDRQLGY